MDLSINFTDIEKKKLEEMESYYGLPSNIIITNIIKN